MTFTIPDAAFDLLGYVIVFLLMASLFAGIVAVLRDKDYERHLASRDDRIRRLERQLVESERDRTHLQRYLENAQKETGVLADQIERAAAIFGWGAGRDDEDASEVVASAPPPAPGARLYACSFLRTDPDGDEDVEPEHSACLIRAVSKDEAYGKAVRIGKEEYPDKTRSVVVTDRVCEPAAGA